MCQNCYEQLRIKYRPVRVEVLPIGESPPASDKEKRFFYCERLLQDNLYRGIVHAVYGLETGFDVREKTLNLERLRADGFLVNWRSRTADQPTYSIASSKGY